MNAHELLAFVHIEKAAGTSLIHILRRNFLLRYIDARPMRSGPGRIFTSKDLRLALRLNPLINCIGGHSIKPHSNLGDNHSVRYITLLRDPVKRYLSHYRYWTDVLNRDIGFDEFLDMESMSNFQTRKIAGVDDLSLAIHLLRNEFLLVGMVEKFDEFLVLLKAILRRTDFSITYIKKNVAKPGTRADELAEKYKADILDRNQLDLQLYDYVRATLYPTYLSHLAISTADIQNATTRVDKLNLIEKTKSYIDYGFRKAYYEPIVGCLRKVNGRSYSGHY